MHKIQELDKNGSLASMPQKEASRLRHEQARLERNLSGIANLTGMPGALVIVDVNREAIAVKEANRMGIPVIAIVDTNTDPDPIQYPIPGNDDATHSIKLIVNVLADAIVKAGAEYAVVAGKGTGRRGKRAAATEASRPRARKGRGGDHRPGSRSPRAGARSGRSAHGPGASADEKESDAKERKRRKSPKPRP